MEKLGLDIPPPPEVTLEEVTAHEIRIAWKQPDFHNSIHKHIIQVNGAKGIHLFSDSSVAGKGGTDGSVGESKRAETVVEILDLAPGNIYHVCVASVSAANFQTPSAILHIRTKSSSLSQSQENDSIGFPTIRASIPRSTAGLATPSAPVMSREQSGSLLQGKRPSAGRRQSPMTNGVDTPQGQTDEVQRTTTTHNSRDKTLEQLADRLKGLQHENENVEKQVTDEEEEHIALLKDMEKQRDEMKKRVREKDEASNDLRKHVYKLESVNRSVQGEKSKRERLMQQKEAERQKRKNDIVRWRDQIAKIVAGAAHAKEEKERLEEQKRKRTDEIREKVANEQTEMKGIDDDIQSKGGRVKKLEEERKGHQGGDSSEDGKELDRIDHERARQWEIKLTHLQARYAALVSLHAQAQQQYQEAQDRLKWLTNQQPSNSAAGPFSLPALDMDFSNTATVRPRRHRSSLTSNVSSPINFTGIDPSFTGGINYNPPSTNSPPFVPSSAFFNINNGMALPGMADLTDTLRNGDLDLSFGNNPQMSPRADALLPSDLLGDEESPEIPHPPVRARFADLESNAPIENFSQDTSSPAASSGSRPGSHFASPPENQSRQETDPQQVPLEIADDNAPKSASRRLSGIFGFHRPRGKTLAEDPPLLGSLKPNQSQSYPRNVDEMDPIGSRRRRLSHTGDWTSSVSLHPKNNANNVTADSSSDQAPSRRAAFSNIFSSSRFGFGKHGEGSDFSTGYNQFSPRHDPIDPSSILGTVRRGSISPRPSSTFSFENHLPHPSTDNRHFGWPSMDKPDNRSPLGINWTSPSTWSRGLSRRPSTQFSSSGHLPLSLTGEPEFLQDSYERQSRPLQAPIGTRPSSSHRPVTPKLNPTAPSFTTVFSEHSDEEREKEKGRDRNADGSSDLHTDDASESRLSRDSQSLSGFTGDSYESLERVPSNISAENGHSKGSFIRKLTRKGSSNRFGSWKDRASLFSKKGESSHGDIDEDRASEIQLGKSVDSTASSAPSADRSIRSLNIFSRKSKRSDKAASETSELASEAGDEDTPVETTTPS